MDEALEILRSGRKTLSLEVKNDRSLRVRAPWGLPEAEIRRFVEKKRRWIEKQRQRLRERTAETARPEPLTAAELRSLAEAMARELPDKLAHYAPLLGVHFGRVTVRAQRSRWGSCSAKGNLNFNCLLMLAPEPVRDYVIVHELCHRREMNHSKRFWALVERVLPDYKERRAWLKEQGGALMARLPEKDAQP